MRAAVCAGILDGEAARKQLWELIRAEAADESATDIGIYEVPSMNAVALIELCAIGKSLGRSTEPADPAHAARSAERIRQAESLFENYKREHPKK